MNTSDSGEPGNVQMALSAVLEKTVTLIEVLAVHAKRAACWRLLKQFYPPVNSKNIVCVAKVSFVMDDAKVNDLTPETQTIGTCSLTHRRMRCAPP